MKVWLDDERPMPKDYDAHAKTAAEAIKLLSGGDVTRISLDHDLGDGNKTGYDVAKWIAEKAYRSAIPPLGWTLHTANPVGRDNMKAALLNADKYWRKNGML